MNRDVYRYSFVQNVALTNVEETLSLAMTATESLHGQPDVRLDASYTVDETLRSITVDATTEVGRCICRIFAGFLSRTIGEDAFEVRRVDTHAISLGGKEEPLGAAG